MSTEKSPAAKRCISPRGPSPTKIMLLGEAPGEQEERLGMPFVGPSGRELERMLMEAGINPGSTFMTNVFHVRPTNNQLSSLMMSAAEWKSFSTAKPNNSQSASTPGLPMNSAPGLPGPWGTTGIPPMKVEQKLMYLRPEYYSELARLHEEILQCSPNVIIALGNTALWSLTGKQNISSLRGTTLASSTLSVSRKVLPTFHPAAVLRQWDMRSIVVADLIKARIQSEFPEVRRPQRKILINPSLTDIENFLQLLPICSALACDVETRNGQITEIGFAPSATHALVVPFIRGYNSHYWPSAFEESSALRLVRAILQHPVPKVFQNGLYDLQYIWKTWHFAPRACLHDTMLKHHSMFPELQKGLGFLGSLYTDEPAWKLMRTKDTAEKRDDE